MTLLTYLHVVHRIAVVFFFDMAQERRMCYDRAHVLGHGNFGVVFKGKLDGTIDVAVKRIELARLASSTFKEREMKHQQELDHSNVVKLLHVEEDENFL